MRAWKAVLDEYPGGTGEYQGGTGEYPGGTDEYLSSNASKAEPWWQREGYSSLAEALAEEIAMGDRVMGRKPRDLEGLDLEEVVSLSRSPWSAAQGAPARAGAR